MARSHNSVKGNTSWMTERLEYCQLQRRVIQIRVRGEGKRMAEGDFRWSGLKKTVACFTARMRRGGEKGEIQILKPDSWMTADVLS